MSILRNFLLKIDSFGPPITLNINNKSRNKTNIGGILTLLSFCIFIFIFYTEFIEVYNKNKPFISYHNDKLVYTTSSMEFSNKTFPFFISLYYKKNKTEDLLKYLHIDVHFYLHNTTEQSSKKVNIQLDKCNEDDEKLFQLFIPDFNFNDINDDEYLCPRYFDYENYRGLSSFYMIIEVDIRKCKVNDKGCTVNETIYELMDKNDLLYYYNFHQMDTRVNLSNYHNPFIYQFNIKNIISREHNVLFTDLTTIEVNTANDYLFPIEGKKFAYKQISKNNISKDEFNYAVFVVTQNLSIDVYDRHYKTFNSALANTFSVVKIYLILTKILMKLICKYKLNNFLINNIFDYEFYKENSKVNSNNFKEDSLLINSNIINNNSDGKSNYMNCKETHQNYKKKKLFSYNLKDLTKRIFCSANKKKLKFYTITKKSINRLISIEEIIKLFIEFKRFKILMLDEYKLALFNRINRIIIYDEDSKEKNKLLDIKNLFADGNDEEILNVIKDIDYQKYPELYNALDNNIINSINK